MRVQGDEREQDEPVRAVSLDLEEHMSRDADTVRSLGYQTKLSRVRDKVRDYLDHLPCTCDTCTYLDAVRREVE